MGAGDNKTLPERLRGFRDNVDGDWVWSELLTHAQAELDAAAVALEAAEAEAYERVLQAERECLEETEALATRLAAAEARLVAVERERDRKQESNLVLIADAQRWQRAYGKRCDDVAAAEARVVALTEELADANQVAEAAMDAHEETCARVAALEDGLQRITSLARQVHPVAGYIFRDDDPAKIARAVLASSVKQEQGEGLGGSAAARSGGGQ